MSRFHYFRSTKLFVVLFLTLFWLAGCGDDDVADDDLNQESTNQTNANQANANQANANQANANQANANQANANQANANQANANQGDPDTYAVGGTVTGIESGSLTLQNNGGDDLVITADGSFEFSDEVADGEGYEVTILEAPQHHECGVENGSGVIDGAGVTDVAIHCELGEISGAFFTVAINAEESVLEVEEGQTASVRVRVDNIGADLGPTTIALRIDGESVDTESFALLGGAGQSITLEWTPEDGQVGTFAAEVTSDDDSDSTEITVNERDRSAYFAVSINDDDSTLEATAGEEITVVAYVENTGEESGTRDVEFVIDGEVVASTADLTLDGGASQEVTLVWDTDLADAGDFSGIVTTGDAQASVSGSLLAPAYFDVTIDDEASTLEVVAGEPLTVVAAVENTGDLEGTATIEFSVGGEVMDSTELTLEGGDDQDVSFQWSTSEDDIGTFEVVVSSADDQGQATATVLAPAQFEVTINETESTLNVLAGEPVTVVATVENTGGVTASQDVVLTINGDLRDEISSLELAAGEDQEVTLEWMTTSDDGGSFTAQVATDNASDEATGTVTLPANFVVSIVEGESTLTVSEGDPVEVVVDVVNTGDLADSQDITLTIGGEVRDTYLDLNLAGQGSEQITLVWDTEEGDASFYTAQVASANTSDSASVTVSGLDLAPAFFRPTIVLTESSLEVVQGADIEVEVTIENLGDEEGTQQIALEVDGVVEDSQEITLDAGASQTLTLTWTTTSEDRGTFSVQVTTENESADTTAQVNAPAFFAVEIDEQASLLSVVEGQTVSVVALVENTGDLSDEQTIALSIDGEEVDTSTITVAGGAEASVTLEWTTEAGDEGSFEAIVTSDDDSDTATGEVTPPEPMSLSGFVTDATGETSMEGVEVVLLEAGTEIVVDTTFVGSDETYDFGELAPGDYDLRLQAPGLEPNYSVDEVGGATEVSVSLVDESITQDFTVDWIRVTNIYIDSGILDLFYGDPEEDLSIEFPGCEYDETEDAWVPQEVEAGETTEVSFNPDDECFQIQQVGVDLLTGELDLTVGDILFPVVVLFIDDSADNIHSMVNWVEVEFNWIFDAISGEVDFRTGTLDLDIDLRILIGGTVNAFLIGDRNFGSRAGFDDCQLTAAWGGDVDNPSQDGSGNYLHDPITLRLTTGESGAIPVTGQGYDAGTGYFLVVDNEFTMGRLSEGQYGNDDEGGASCGELYHRVVLGDDVEEDYAEILNNLLALPSGPGDMYLELDLILPQQ